jgi:hypothetical protein
VLPSNFAKPNKGKRHDNKLNLPTKHKKAQFSAYLKQKAVVAALHQAMKKNMSKLHTCRQM